MTTVFSMQNDTNRLAKNYSVYTIGRLLGVLSSVALIPLFTKALPQAEFGVIGVLWLVSPLLSRMLNLGVDVSVSLKYFKLKDSEMANNVYHALLIISVMTIIIFVLIFIRIDLVHRFIDDGITRTLFTWLYFSIVSRMLLSMMQTFLQLSNKPVWNVVTTVLPPLLVTISTYTLVIVNSPTYSSYIYGMAIGYGIFGLISIAYFLKRYAPKHFIFSLGILKRLFRVGLPILPTTISVLLLSAGDRYVIKQQLGLEAVAIYAFGYRFAEYIMLSIFRPFQKAMMPIVREKAARDLQSTTKYTIDLTIRTVLMMSMALAIIVVPSKDILNFLSGDKYFLSYPIYLLVLYGVMLDNVWRINGQLLHHLERTDILMLISIFSAILNISLNIVFVKQYGVLAAGFTTIISFLLVLIVSTIAVNRNVEIKVPLFNVIYATIPLVLYGTLIYFIDTSHIFSATPTLALYLVKILLLSCFLGVHYHFSSGVREITDKIMVGVHTILTRSS